MMASTTSIWPQFYVIGHNQPMSNDIGDGRKQQEFVVALTALERAAEAQSLPLQSFLILPMQHVTRLPLLVDAILHQLDVQRGNRSSEDCTAVGRCLETLHTVN